MAPPLPPGDYPRVGGRESSTTGVAGSQTASRPPPQTCAVYFPPSWPAGPPLTYLNWQLKRHSNCYKQVGPPLRQARDEMAAHRRRRAATAESRNGEGERQGKGKWSRGLQRERGL